VFSNQKCGFRFKSVVNKVKHPKIKQIDDTICSKKVSTIKIREMRMILMMSVMILNEFDFNFGVLKWFIDS
jgi:hypothetical protein